MTATRISNSSVFCYLILNRGRGGCGSGGSGSGGGLDALRCADGHASRNTGGLGKERGWLHKGYEHREIKQGIRKGVVPGRRERG